MQSTGMEKFKLDQYRNRWSFYSGATKATPRANGQALTDLTEALAEVDGLLAGITFLEKVEPDCRGAASASPPNENANDPSKSSWTDNPWLGKLSIDLQQLEILSSEKQPQIDAQDLRNHLNGKVNNSNRTSGPAPRESQWATLRGLRQASRYHYRQFVKATADSTLHGIRKLRMSYVTSNDLLEVGILTFRAVLQGQKPTTLMEIFAFASLSYVISKILHARGHLEDSDILSGLMDWRSAIEDEGEISAFDEIAQRLWPEAKDILHFIPLEKNLKTSQYVDSRDGQNQACSPTPTPNKPMDLETSIPTEEAYFSRLDLPLLPSWEHEYASISQDDTLHRPRFGQLEDDPGGLQNQAMQLVKGTRLHDDCRFSDFLNFDGTLQEDYMDSSFDDAAPPDINPAVLGQPSLRCSVDMQLPILSDSHSSPRWSPEDAIPVEPIDLTTSDDILDRLVKTSLFSIVCRYLAHLTHDGDLLKILSGGGLTSQQDGMKSPHSPSYYALRSLDQAPRHLFGPLNCQAAQVDDEFGGIIAMAETFVRLGLIHTVREVENYIIAVGRYLSRSFQLFASLVNKTLLQCLLASRGMTYNLLYPSCIKELDEYSFDYINKREKEEKNWANIAFSSLELSKGRSSSVSSKAKTYDKNSSSPRKRPHDGSSAPVRKRRQRDIALTESRSPSSESLSQSPSDSHTSKVEHCKYPDCPKVFTGTAARNNLARHVRTIHVKEKIMKCTQCEKVDSRRDNLRQHFLAVHYPKHQIPGCIAETGRDLCAA